MRCRMARNVALMKPEVSAAQALEIRHARVIESGGPIPIFVGNHILAGGSVVPLLSSRDLGAQKLQTPGIEDPRALFGEPDFDDALLIERIPPEKQPHHSHIVPA